MKLFLFIIFFSVTSALAQQDEANRTYLDSLGKKTEKENARSYRTIGNYEDATKSFPFKEFYMSDVLKSEGKTTEQDFLKEEGAVITYHENGKRESISNYRDGRIFGLYVDWYPDGKQKTEGTYVQKKLEDELVIKRFWDESGVQQVNNGNGTYTQTDEKTTSKGPVLNGLKDGEWKGNNTSKGYSFVEIYAKGQLLRGTTTFEGKEFQYSDVIVKPSVKGGLKSFYEFVQRNFVRQEDEGKGRVIISFIIGTDGMPGDYKVVRSVDSRSDAEAIRVIEKYGAWQPGYQRGLPVKVSYYLPISLN